MTARCTATWHDDLDHRTGDTAPCLLAPGHAGPHRNHRMGITWGDADDWFGNDAA